MSLAKLEVEGLSKVFGGNGATFPVLEGVNLVVFPREFVSILGPSGCGKSSLFNILVGLLPPTSGAIRCDGIPVHGVSGRFGYMLQRDLLLPWRTVLGNAIIPLEIGGTPREKALAEARALLPQFGLQGFADYYPAMLSGGMRQRVALLRTFLQHRDILLLDEPFGALDAMTRSLMQQWLLSLWQEWKSTILFVTHDVDEAILLSDRIYVMTARPGRIKLEKAVTLSRPRPPVAEILPEFTALKSELLEMIQEESVRAFQEEAS